MERFFQLISFNYLTVIVAFSVLPHQTRAEDSSLDTYFNELRKAGPLTPSKIESIRSKTIDQANVNSANQTLQKQRAEQKAKPEPQDSKEDIAASEKELAEEGLKEDVDDDEKEVSEKSAVIKATGSKGSTWDTNKSTKGTARESTPPAPAARLNLKDEDLPQDMHFPAATPTPTSHKYNRKK